MALSALFNEGVRAHFFHLMEVPTMRLPNVKMLLRWPSRMHIYGFVRSRTFFYMMEQFDSMGVPAHFLNFGTLWLCWSSRMHIYCFAWLPLVR